MREEKAKDGRRRRKTKPAACQSKGVDNDSFEMEECKRPDSRPEVPAESLQHMQMEESPRQHKPRTRKSTISSASAIDAESASVAPDTGANENEVVGIVIHRTDQLRATADVRYAMVRVHVMNEHMGTYYLRQRQLPSSGDRKWSQFIQPVWCAPIELLQGPAKLPVWEELLFINEQYGYIADTPSTVLLFELLNIRTHPGNLDLSRCTQAEHRVSTIAWAFLRLVGANGHTNTGLKKQRLQLFEPAPNCKPPGINLSQQRSKHGMIKKFPEPMAAGQHLFDWWRMGSSARIKYPSTLYVTVKKINIGQQVCGSEFSVDRLTNLTNLEKAGGQISKQSLSHAEDQFSDISEATIHRVDSELWRRSPDQPCRIPNEFIGSGTNELLLLPEDVTVSGSDARTRRTCGSHAVKFSPNGKWIAVGSASEAASGSRPLVVGQILSTDAPVFVYKHPFRLQSATPHLQLAGHTKIVYSVDWSPTPIISQVNRDSKSPGQMTAWLLASASADGTVRVWWLPPEQLRGRSIKKDLGINPIGVSSPVHVTPDDGKAVTGETSRRGIFCTVLGHPSFVYSAQFSPHPVSGGEQDEQTVEHILATAGFDQIVRLWKIGQLKAELLCELNGQHHAHINSLAFSVDGQKLYSADAKGILVVWNRVEHRKHQSTTWSWRFDRAISEPEFKGTVNLRSPLLFRYHHPLSPKGAAINHVEEHPTQSLLLVHTRDSCIKMVDLRWGLISAQLLGGQNYRELLRSCISPCGSFVFSGSEDHNVYVWSAVTGDQVACYRQLQFSGSVKSISFHPTQHVVVFASLDREQPVCVYTFNPLRAARIREAPFLQLSDIAESKSVLSTEETSRLDRIHVDQERRKATRIRRALAKLDSVKVMRYIPFVAEESLDDREWRPKFTTIGEVGSHKEPLPESPTTEMRGRPDGEAGQSSTLSPRRTTGAEVLEEGRIATLLFDYQAQRSDELTLPHGSRVKLLYKDGLKWWMVRTLDSNREGYVPTNYLACEAEMGKSGDRKPMSTSNEVNNANAFPAPFNTAISTPAAKARTAAYRVAALIRERGHPRPRQEYEMHPLPNKPCEGESATQFDDADLSVRNSRRKTRPLPEGGVMQYAKETPSAKPMKRKPRPLPQFEW